MLQTNQIAQPLHRKGGKPEIFEFSGPVQGSRIINNVVVDVCPVGVCCNDKSVLALQKTLCKLVADAVSFLRRNFSRLERLPHLIGDHFAFLAASGGLLVQPFRQQKFFVYGQRAALIAADKFAFFSLVRILCIVGAVFQAGGNRFSFVLMQCDQTSSSQSRSPPK